MNEHKVIAPPEVGYDEDLYAWSQDQAARLRASRPARIDWSHVAEEIESLGKSDRRSLKSDLKVVIEHLIKWRYQAQKRKSGWRSTINEHRDRIERIIEDSPSLAGVPAAASPSSTGRRGATRFRIRTCRRPIFPRLVLSQ